MSHTADLIDRAKAATGLMQFGADCFRDGLERLVAAAAATARFNTFGAAAFEAQLVDLLGQRLKVEDWHRRHPEIAEEQIVAPLIGLGLPRTGSTALACLLGEDPAARSLHNWEAMNPTPPPAFAPETATERIALAEAAMERRAALFPRMQQLLPSTARSPTECQLFMGHDFKSQLFAAFAWIPVYAEWLETQADLEPTYLYLKRVLQLLQWRAARPVRWRLKNPTHSLFIISLSKVFPDARYVMTHRAIAEVIPSVADVYFELSQAYSDHANRAALAELNTASWDRAMRRMIAYRDAGNEHRFFDLAFRPFMRDPFPQLERLYAWLGEELTTETRAAMLAWRTNAPREKVDRDVDAYRIDPAALTTRFAFYHRRFAGVLDDV
jgi:Sulfotransferase family